MTVERVRLRRPRSEQGRQLARKIERPPAHWLMLGLFLGGLLLLLLVQGLTVKTTGASGTPPQRHPGQAPALKTNAALLVAGPGDTLVPREAPVGRRIALTFDDGPDPRWTPAIADTLKRLHAPATFFAVGEHVIRHPGIVADLHDDGFELGNHTFSHADLASAGRLRGLQISLTESAISGAAGVRPRFVRPPYSATPDAVDAGQEHA